MIASKINVNRFCFKMLFFKDTCTLVCGGVVLHFCLIFVFAFFVFLEEFLTMNPSYCIRKRQLMCVKNFQNKSFFPTLKK